MEGIIGIGIEIATEITVVRDYGHIETELLGVVLGWTFMFGFSRSIGGGIGIHDLPGFRT